MGFVGKVLKTAVVGGAIAAGVGAFAVAPRSLGARRKAGVGDMLDVPFAHRGLHSDKDGVPENSLEAFRRACEAGYGIELDVQLTADGEVVVVHDADLARVVGDARPISAVTLAELKDAPLLIGGKKPVAAKAQYIPTLAEVLDVVAGRVPLIVEFKMGQQLNQELMERADDILWSYEGWYCIESFNPLAVHWYRKNRPDILRGQLASAPTTTITKIRDQDAAYRWTAGHLLLNWVGRPDFVAYEWHGGNEPGLRASTAMGAVPVAWTVRSESALIETVQSFDRFIFEDFLPDII